MDVPEDLASLLAGPPDVNAHEQAFPFLTVDDQGFPHVALLSRAELDVPDDRSKIFAVVASARTRENLERDGHAGLIAIRGTVAHYAKMTVDHHRVEQDLFGCVLTLADYKADSIGVPMEGVSFRTTAEIAAAEMWQRSSDVLSSLAASG